MKTFLDHAKARKFRAADRDRIIRERHWTGHELLSDADYQDLIAADQERHSAEPAPEGAPDEEGGKR